MKTEPYKCPGCGGKLGHVPPSKWMNDEQWDASKAGDYFCDECPESVGTASTSDTGYAYFNEEHLDATRVRAPQPATCRGATND